jgi:hypothetical protein
VLADSSLLLGQDLLAYLVLALGAAMLVGNVLALLRPPAKKTTGQLNRAPLGRTLTMATVGLLAAVWALASLTK